jgi:hypothetical protein
MVRLLAAVRAWVDAAALRCIDSDAIATATAAVADVLATVMRDVSRRGSGDAPPAPAGASWFP